MLAVSGLVSGYVKGITIIKGISMRVENKSVVSIIGPNGAGKSTILKTLFGFLKPEEGKIIFDDEDITGQSPDILKWKGISYIPQDTGTFYQMSIEDNLMLSGWTLRKDKGMIKKKLEESYSRFPGLKERAHAKAGFLSGGQRRMLDIAMGLFTDPKLVLIDEPSAGLAPAIAGQIYDQITKIKEGGASVLLVDQSIQKAVEVSDYVYLIEMGVIAFEGVRGLFESRLRDIIRSTLTGRDV